MTTPSVEREVLESPLPQGTDEIISYRLDTTPWGGTPSNPVVTIYDVSLGGYTVLTAAQMAVVMPVNTPTIGGNYITLSPLKSLTLGKTYRVEIRFDSGGDTWETWFKVTAEH